MQILGDEKQWAPRASRSCSKRICCSAYPRNMARARRRRDPVLLTRLETALLMASPSDAALMTPGDPTIVILDDRKVLLTIQCLQPDFIRLTALPDGDARLHDPEVLRRWRAQQQPSP